MNRGAQDLAGKLTERGAQQRLADELGTSSGVITHWLNGTRKPNAKFRGLLNALHGIPWPRWDEDVAQEGDAA